MLVVSLVVVALLWMAYSWALNQPNVPNPAGLLVRVGGALARLPLA